MKNYYKQLSPDFELGEVVPPKIRLKVYKKVLSLFLDNLKNGGDSSRIIKACKSGGLCIVLPCVLFNLKCMMDVQPTTKTEWSWSNTTYSFPELTEEEISKITGNYDLYVERTQRRIDFLKKAIKQVELIIKNK